VKDDEEDGNKDNGAGQVKAERHQTDGLQAYPSFEESLQKKKWGIVWSRKVLPKLSKKRVLSFRFGASGKKLPLNHLSVCEKKTGARRLRRCHLKWPLHVINEQEALAIHGDDDHVSGLRKDLQQS
jgi:hypothetical protein